MSLHVAIEDETPEPDEPEGLFDCRICGEPTWYALCNSCHAEEREARGGSDE